SRRLGIHGTGADSGHLVVGSQHIASARQNQEFSCCRGDEHRLQPPQATVHPPVFRKFNGSALHVTPIAVELLFKTVKQGESIGCRTGKPRQHFAILQLPDLSYVALSYIIAHRRLPVATDGYVSVVKYGEYG